MKNVTIALLSFVDFGSAKMFEFAAAVIAAMTGNTNFPNSDIYLDPVKRAFDAFKKALENAKTGNSSQKADRRAKQKVLVDALKELCAFVNLTAKGDRTALLSTGFQVSKEFKTPSTLLPLTDVLVNYGDNIGDIKVEIKKEKGVKAVNYMYTLDINPTPDSAWKMISSSAKSCIISGLPAGKTVTIYVSVIGTRKQVMNSEYISKKVR